VPALSVFEHLDAKQLLPIWEGVRARAVNGERMTLAVIELDSGAHVPEHRHENEQLGLVLHGSIRMRIDEEDRDLVPGDTYRILADTPHEANAGPDGAVVLDVFAPVRSDWEAFEPQEPSEPRWPGA
jgi:quercetin dioxygenase-like cupin family protein